VSLLDIPRLSQSASLAVGTNFPGALPPSANKPHIHAERATGGRRQPVRFLFPSGWSRPTEALSELLGTTAKFHYWFSS
jgi:hypothetical protein